MDYDDLFIKSYLKDVQENENKKIRVSKEERAIAKEKEAKLEFIKKFLQKFVDLGVRVHHSDQYTKNTKTDVTNSPQDFSFYIIDSSKSWAPGFSILFNHPAMVEIAIPNNPEYEGVVVIKVATHHPDAYILEQKFSTYESACEALGRFLGKCTHSIKQDPKKYLKNVEQNKQIHPEKQSLQNLPDITPEPSLKSGAVSHEPLVLKEDATTLKKIGNFFGVTKDTNDDDD